MSKARPAFRGLHVQIELVVLLLAAAWFTFNVGMPDGYNGRICCDSVGYIDIARRLESIPQILQHYDYRTLGYPLFLRLHTFLMEPLGLASADGWTATRASLFTVFILFVASSYFLYHSFRRRGIQIPRAGLWLLLLHPGLIGNAALPLSDIPALILVMTVAGCLLRLEWKADRLGISLCALIGVLCGLLVLTRTVYYLPVLLMFALSLAVAAFVSARRRTALVVLPLVCIVYFGAVTAPRIAACTRHAKTLCFVAPQDRDKNLRFLVDASGPGPRTYGVLRYAENGKFEHYSTTVPDPLFLKHFQCLPHDQPYLRGFARCYLKNLPLLPVYMGKKVIGLFDNFHRSAYGAVLTTTWEIAVSRAFGTMGWIGFWCAWGIVIVQACRRRLDVRLAFLALFCGAYLGLSLLVSIEARYGFPFVPFSLFAFTWTFAWAMKKQTTAAVVIMIACILAGAVFLSQTAAWDQDDPLLLHGAPGGL